MYPSFRSLMKRYLGVFLVCLVCIASLSFVHLTTHAANTSSLASKNTAGTSFSCGGWNAIPTPGKGQFTSVAAISANDVWAVGYTIYYARTLIEHWDGSMRVYCAKPRIRER